jgi:hypothetical protein
MSESPKTHEAMSDLDIRLYEATSHFRMIRESLRILKEDDERQIFDVEDYAEDIKEILNGATVAKANQWLYEFVGRMTEEDKEVWNEGVFPDFIAEAIEQHLAPLHNAQESVGKHAASLKEEAEGEFLSVISMLDPGKDLELCAQIAVRLGIDGDSESNTGEPNGHTILSQRLDKWIQKEEESGNEPLRARLNKALPHKWNSFCDAYRQVTNRLMNLGH